MKKIQSKYLLWAVVATFSLNVGAPVLAAEPKPEKVSFAQRINLLIKAKEWLKETNELKKKFWAGTATKEEKKRWVRKAAILVTALLLLGSSSLLWLWKVKIDSARRMAKIKKKRGEYADRTAFFKAETEALEEFLAILEEKEGALIRKNKEIRIVTIARKVLLERLTEEDAIHELIYVVGVAEAEYHERTRPLLMGTREERAGAILDQAIAKVRKAEAVVE